jgi:hypothetical protein
MPIKDINKISVREQQYINEYISNGGNGRQAIIDAGYKVKNRESAGSMALQKNEKPAIRARIEQAMEALELTPSFVLNGHKTLYKGSLNKKNEPKSPSYGMVASRSLENIGKIGNMYPREGSELDISRDGIKLKWQTSE